MKIYFQKLIWKIAGYSKVGVKVVLGSDSLCFFKG